MNAETQEKEPVMAQAAKVIEHEASAVVPLAPTAPMAMLAQAIDKGMTPDVIDKLMGLAERWDKVQARKAFDRAIAAAKVAIPVIIKNAKGHNDKRYADLAAIARAVDPVLGEHGLSYRFRTVQDEKLIRVTCVLSHEAGHSEETTLAGPADATGSKNAIQAIGSTLTYLQRYSLVQALGLAAAEDDDGKSANGNAVTQEQADKLIDLLESNSKDRAKFLKWAKVEKITDIPAANYQACVDAITHRAVQS